MTFRVGQKVVCVNAKPRNVGFRIRGLVEGAIYTVRRVGIQSHPELGEQPSIWLEETVRSCPFYDIGDLGSHVSRFRPAVERKTDISFAHEILRKASKPARGPMVALQHHQGNTP
jgi:hypothetical protein